MIFPDFPDGNGGENRNADENGAKEKENENSVSQPGFCTHLNRDKRTRKLTTVNKEAVLQQYTVRPKKAWVKATGKRKNRGFRGKPAREPRFFAAVLAFSAAVSVCLFIRFHFVAAGSLKGEAPSRSFIQAPAIAPSIFRNKNLCLIIPL